MQAFPFHIHHNNCLIFWKLHSWNMHAQRTRKGKCSQAARCNLFCIWGFNTTTLCSPTEALHRKAVNKTPQRHSLGESSPTCSCHSRRTERRAELLTHLAHDRENDMMGRRGEGRQGERVWGGESVYITSSYNILAVGAFFEGKIGCNTVYLQL